jgi:hypothetical protein
MADDLQQEYQARVERVPHDPMSEVAPAAILAEVETTYRRELGEWPKTDELLARFDLRATPPTAGYRPP